MPDGFSNSCCCRSFVHASHAAHTAPHEQPLGATAVAETSNGTVSEGRVSLYDWRSWAPSPCVRWCGGVLVAASVSVACDDGSTKKRVRRPGAPAASPDVAASGGRSTVREVAGTKRRARAVRGSGKRRSRRRFVDRRRARRRGGRRDVARSGRQARSRATRKRASSGVISRRARAAACPATLPMCDDFLGGFRSPDPARVLVFHLTPGLDEVRFRLARRPTTARTPRTRVASTWKPLDAGARGRGRRHVDVRPVERATDRPSSGSETASRCSPRTPAEQSGNSGADGRVMQIVPTTHTDAGKLEFAFSCFNGRRERGASPTACDRAFHISGWGRFFVSVVLSACSSGSGTGHQAPPGRGSGGRR